MQNKESLHETDINKIPYLITFKNIPRIDFVSHIIQTCIIAVGNNGLRDTFKLLQVIHNKRAEESTAIFQCRFINHQFGTFSLDTFHYPLNGTLAEIIRV